jgi:hypothetical protein
MRTETYNGIAIFFDAAKRLYFTKALIYKRTNNRSRGYVMSTRLERVKEEIDIFIRMATAQKKRSFVFIKGSRYDKGYMKARILLFDKISNCITVMVGKKINTYALSDYKFNTDKIFLDTRKNQILIDEMAICNSEIIKQKELIANAQAKLVAARSNIY